MHVRWKLYRALCPRADPTDAIAPRDINLAGIIACVGRSTHLHSSSAFCQGRVLSDRVEEDHEAQRSASLEGKLYSFHGTAAGRAVLWWGAGLVAVAGDESLHLVRICSNSLAISRCTQTSHMALALLPIALMVEVQRTC